MKYIAILAFAAIAFTLSSCARREPAPTTYTTHTTTASTGYVK